MKFYYIGLSVLYNWSVCSISGSQRHSSFILFQLCILFFSFPKIYLYSYELKNIGWGKSKFIVLCEIDFILVVLLINYFRFIAVL